MIATSLRDYFAGLAMQGVLSNVDRYKVPPYPADKDIYIKLIAHDAYKIADAMLKESQKIAEWINNQKFEVVKKVVK